jgi:peptide/nickel transport system substrate-binding protein
MRGPMSFGLMSRMNCNYNLPVQPQQAIRPCEEEAMNYNVQPQRKRPGRLATMVVAAAALAGSFTLPALAETPQRGGTLSVSLQLTSGSLDPLFGNGADRKFLNMFAETLVFQDSNYQFSPRLAESWELENGGKSIVFHLRQGVVFHDGTPFNAESVKFNLERLMDTSIAHTKKAAAAMLESVEVIDDATVRVNFKEPSELSLVMLANAEGSICSPKAITELGADFARQPSCTGPFVIESWTGNEYVAKKNPNYWAMGEDGQPLPYLDGIKVNIQSNSAVRLVELRAGAIQYTDYVLPKDFSQVTDDSSLQLVDIRHGLHEYIAFNVAKPPFDNKDLREAVALGIDRDALVKVVAPGIASTLKYLESPEELWVYDDSVAGHVYDPDRAREAFKRSGFNGEVSLMVIQRDPDIQIAQLLQGMLGSIGLKLSIEVVERQGFLDKMNALKHDFLIARMEHGVDPDGQYSAFFDERGVFNVTGVDRTETTKLVGAARVELDREKRRGIYRQVTDIILENYIFSWLIRVPYQDAASKRLHNISLDASKALVYGSVWLTD